MSNVRAFFLALPLTIIVLFLAIAGASVETMVIAAVVYLVCVGIGVLGLDKKRD